MNRLIKYISALVIICTVIVTECYAKAYNPDNIPLTKNSDYPNYISNPDGILSEAATDTINRMLLSLEKVKGVKSLVIVVKNIEGDDPYQFAIGVGNKYKVGTKDNTGIVIVLATEDRSYYILTGEGMEKFLPDAICKRIENRVMVPLLKKGEWNLAMVNTVYAIKSILDNESELKNNYSNNGDGDLFLAIFVLIGIAFIVMIVISMVHSWNAKKCPHCGKHKLRFASQNSRFGNAHNIITTKKYVCSNCNNVVYKEHEEIDDRYDGGAGGIFLGGFGGGFGAGGSRDGGSFGSFGGGSFGGGGAGGRF